MGWQPHENLTNGAAHVLSYAEDLAQQSNLNAVQPEHILRALAAYNRGPAIDVLRACGLDLGSCIDELPESPSLSTRPSKPTRLAFDAEATQMLAYGKEEGARIGLDCVGTEHLLLGLLQLRGSAAGEFLLGRGVTVEVARAALRKLYKMPSDTGQE